MYKRFWLKGQMLAFFRDHQTHIFVLPARKYSIWVVYAMQSIVPKYFSSAPKRLCLLLIRDTSGGTILGDTIKDAYFLAGLSLLITDVLKVSFWQRWPYSLTSSLVLAHTHSSSFLWFHVVKTLHPCSWQILGRNLLPGTRQTTRRSRWQLWAEAERNPQEKAVWKVMSTRANLYFND